VTLRDILKFAEGLEGRFERPDARAAPGRDPGIRFGSAARDPRPKRPGIAWRCCLYRRLQSGPASLGSYHTESRPKKENGRPIIKSRLNFDYA
jgi:hypothetical protein